MEEDLRHHALELEVNDQPRNGMRQRPQAEITRAHIDVGNLKAIQMMIKRIEYPDGKVDNGPVPMKTIRKLSLPVRRVITRTINEWNPGEDSPLDQEETVTEMDQEPVTYPAQ